MNSIFKKFILIATIVSSLQNNQLSAKKVKFGGKCTVTGQCDKNLWCSGWKCKKVFDPIRDYKGSMKRIGKDFEGCFTTDFKKILLAAGIGGLVGAAAGAVAICLAAATSANTIRVGATIVIQPALAASSGIAGLAGATTACLTLNGIALLAPAAFGALVGSLTTASGECIYNVIRHYV